MNQKKPDLEQLRKAAPHVAQDIGMLRDAYPQRESAFAYTAWFIHCRSVMDFLDGRGTNPDDIHAEDYFDDPDAWELIDSGIPRPSDYEDYLTAVHKLAARLTYTRITYAEQGKCKPSKSIHDHLLGRCALFVRALPLKRLPWFAGLGL